MTIQINAQQKRLLQSRANTSSEFEPLAKLGHVGLAVADQLVDLGLAERGPCSPRFAALGYKEGYRLTDAGWRALGTV